MTPRNLLISHGFIEVAPCRCGGYRTLKFKRDTHLVHYRPGTNLFKLTTAGVTMVPYTPIIQLEKTLNELATKTNA